MRRKLVRASTGTVAALMLVTSLPLTALAAVENGWEEVDGKKYWYENGVKQGTEGRGKEIYDPESDAWYWLDAVDDGKMAVSKDVYQESLAGQWGDYVNEAGERCGKWVRYDENGHMIKGWSEDHKYYFDPTFGTMAKAQAEIDGVIYYFNEVTGVLESEGDTSYPDGWNNIDGVDYWYENGVRQGYDSSNPDYRGKEIYDPGSDAWYWLDNVQKGAKATNKDVYQESEAGEWGDVVGKDGKRYGKWVRYDAEGHMIKGWNEKDGNKYYFDPTYGTMAKGYAEIEGTTYYFNEQTGICEGETTVKQGFWWREKEVTDYNADGSVEYNTVYEYYADGGTKSITFYQGKQYKFDRDREYGFYYSTSKDDMYKTHHTEWDDDGRHKSVENWGYTKVSDETYYNSSYELINYEVRDCIDGRELVTIDSTTWYYSEDGKEIKKIVNEYNENGDIVKTNYYQRMNNAETLSLYCVESYKYDEDGNLILLETLDKLTGYVDAKTEYTVNANGLTTVIRDYVADSSTHELKLKSRTTKEYNEAGYETVSYTYNCSSDGIEYCIAKSIYTYYQFNNNYYTKTYDYYSGYYTKNADGSVTFNSKEGDNWAYKKGTENVWDNNGNITKIIYYTSDGNYNKEVSWYEVRNDYTLENVTEASKITIGEPVCEYYNADGSERGKRIVTYISVPISQMD